MCKYNTVSDTKLGYDAEHDSSESEYTSESDCDAESDSDFELDELRTESGDDCAAELREISLVDHQFIFNPNKLAIGFSDLVILPLRARYCPKERTDYQKGSYVEERVEIKGI